MVHKQRNRVLVHAIDQTAKWFSHNGGKLKLVAAPADDEDAPSGKIAFRYGAPQVARRISSMGRGRGPLYPFGRKLSRRRRAAIPDENDARTGGIPDENEARMAGIKYSEVAEYLEPEEDGGGQQKYFAIVETESGIKIATGRE